MEDSLENKIKTRKNRIKTIILSSSLLGLLFLPVTGGTQLLFILMGGLTVMYLLIKLLDWFLRWGWAQIRKQPFTYHHQWLGIGLTLAVYSVIIVVHVYAMHQADQLAIELGTQIQATCDKDKVCSIPEKILAMGKTNSPERLKVLSSALGQEYPVKLTLRESNQSFHIHVFHFFQKGFTVHGGVGEKPQTGDFSE